jgi:MarR family transcriptional regulator for hemolysin
MFGRSIDSKAFDVKGFDIYGSVGMLEIVRPTRPPLGLSLARAARVVSRAFDETLAAAGGSLPTWLVLLNLKIGRAANQRRLAEAVGVTEATLTHHLNAMETAGLVTRHRDPDNRRIHVVELTDAGEAAFLRLRDAAMVFDRKLRRGVSTDEAAALEDVLSRLAANVANDKDGAAPWVGLIEQGT